MIRSASFSPDRTYRYSLTIRWSGGNGLYINFLMLNPSTADEVYNDPTVSRCIKRAQLWGYSGVTVTNIFAFRSTDPSRLYDVTDPIGPDNNTSIWMAALTCETVVCAWGQHGKLMKRGEEVLTALDKLGIQLYYLKLSNDGTPYHPLYLSYAVKPKEWN